MCAPQLQKDISVDLRTLKHKAFINFARFMVNFSPPVSYLAFAGEGSARSLCRHVEHRGVSKLLVVTDKPLVELGVVAQAIAGLADTSVQHAVYDGVTPDPTYAVVENGKAMYLREGCDGLLAIGGGSSIDAAKVIGVAVTHPNDPAEYVGFGKASEEIPPLFAIPTTAGTGSEATMGAVISDTETHEKGIISGKSLLPLAACLDPSLMTGLPPQITAATGMDALTHAVEAYISAWTRGDAREKAAAATRLIYQHLPTACENGSDIRAREAMGHAAYIAGQAINQVNVGNVHAIAHQLGARYGVPHGVANAQVMPHVLRISMPAASARLAELAALVGCNSAEEFVASIQAMNLKLGIPEKVDKLQSSDFDAIAAGALAEADGYAVPYMMSAEDVHSVLSQLT
jgi:alcohol dehydrogenase